MDGNYAITVERRMGSQVLTADRRSDQTDRAVAELRLMRSGSFATLANQRDRKRSQARMPFSRTT
jgi:hypothetical protein